MAARARWKPNLPKAERDRVAELFGDPSAAADLCWQTLVRACRDRRAPWRTPVLATVGPDGAPRARVLVLRAVEPPARQLWLHTDVRSGKVSELRADPRVALTFWDPRQGLQLRVEGGARFETDPAVLGEAWDRVPEASRRNYATADPPGRPCSGDLRYLDDGRPNLALVAVCVERLEWLWLGPDVQRRGESRWRDDAWESRLLVP